MAIKVAPKPEFTDADREVLRKVYQTQMDDYQDSLIRKSDIAYEISVEYENIYNEYIDVVEEIGILRGKIESLEELAKRDGITLDK